jgi:hypothetical protein
MDYVMQKETSGYTIWLVSRHTGSKLEVVAYCGSKREAQRKIKRLAEAKGNS